MPIIWELSLKKLDNSFQFFSGLPILPGTLSLPTYFKIFMSHSKSFVTMPLKFPEYMTLWTESEIQSVKKDKFCQKTYATFKNSKHNTFLSHGSSKFLEP